MYSTRPIYDTIRSYILPYGRVCNVLSPLDLLSPTFIILFAFHINNPGLIQARFLMPAVLFKCRNATLENRGWNKARRPRTKLTESVRYMYKKVKFSEITGAQARSAWWTRVWPHEHIAKAHGTVAITQTVYHISVETVQLWGFPSRTGTDVWTVEKQTQQRCGYNKGIFWQIVVLDATRGRTDVEICSKKTSLQSKQFTWCWFTANCNPVWATTRYSILDWIRKEGHMQKLFK